MEDFYYNSLKSTVLFKGIEKNDLEAMLKCLSVKSQKLKKDSFLFMAGDEINNIGIILEGNLHIIKENIDGERNIIASLFKGDVFAEAICFAGMKESPVTVKANSEAEVLMIEYSKIINSCENVCRFHSKLVKNMLFLLANKNIMLQNRVEILAKKTLRQKMLHYLESLNQGDNITIPFNREQLAEFLCVDRSALSHELSRMQNEGIIKYNKNKFKMLKNQA